VVLLRTLRISVLAYAGVLLFVEVVGPDNGGQFSLTELRRVVTEHIAWFGAIFAGVYVALYARFANQWNYLADVYNQQMAVAIETEKDDSKRRRLMATWEAAFVEDARDLHLARKPMFAEAIRDILKNEDSRQAYLASARSGGPAGLAKFEIELNDAVKNAVPSRPS
jgi:hypothetical protein